MFTQTTGLQWGTCLCKYQKDHVNGLLNNIESPHSHRCFDGNNSMLFSCIKRWLDKLITSCFLVCIYTSNCSSVFECRSRDKMSATAIQKWRRTSWKALAEDEPGCEIWKTQYYNITSILFFSSVEAFCARLAWAYLQPRGKRQLYKDDVKATEMCLESFE